MIVTFTRSGRGVAVTGLDPSLRSFSLNAWTTDSSSLSRLKKVIVSDSDVHPRC